MRRQAIRALAQVKFVMVAGPDGKTPIYPAHTLVRILLGDPSLPRARPADGAEAAMGICNMAPVRWQITRYVALPGYNSDVAAEAVLQGLITFAGPRAADVDDKSLPWRLYSIRIAEALGKWRPLFDPNYDPAQPARYAPPPAAVTDIFNFAVPKVLAPMEQVDFMGKPNPAAVVDIQGLIERRDKLRDGRKKSTLIEGVPETSVDFAPQKKK
jgi:hypothetical protein